MVQQHMHKEKHTAEKIVKTSTKTAKFIRPVADIRHLDTLVKFENSKYLTNKSRFVGDRSSILSFVGAKSEFA